MNILIIDNSNGFTGAFKCALNEALLLKDAHRIVFVTPQNSTNIPLLKEKGFTVYPLPLKEISKSLKAVFQYPFYFIANLVRLKNIIAKEKIELVQVNDFYNLLGAGLKLSGAKIKLITYVRFLPASLPGSLRRLWTNAAQRYSDKVIAVSDAVLQQLPSHPDTIRIYDPALIEENLPPYRASQAEVQFLYLANFTRGKGQEHALAAFKNAYETHKNIRLNYVGGFLNLEKNKRFKEELQEETKRMNLQDVVRFREFDSGVERLLKTSAVLLNFSEAESFSMTCLEASYYGIPVIATRCGGPEEIIVHRETGWLVKKKNIEEMTSAMLQLADDITLREQLGNAARTYVREKFSEQQFLQPFQQLLSSLS